MLVGVQIHYVSQIRWGGGWGWGVIVIMAMEGTRILAAIHKRLIHDNYILLNSIDKFISEIQSTEAKEPQEFSDAWLIAIRKCKISRNLNWAQNVINGKNNLIVQYQKMK